MTAFTQQTALAQRCAKALGVVRHPMPEPRWTEIISGLNLIGWGIYVMLLPEQLGTRTPYAVLGFLSNDGWAAITIIAGLMQASTAWLNHNWMRPMRWLLAVLMAGLWFSLAIGITAGPEHFPGIMLYIGQGVACLVSVVLIPKHRAR